MLSIKTWSVGLLHWHWSDPMIAPVPLEWSWMTWLKLTVPFRSKLTRRRTVENTATSVLPLERVALKWNTRGTTVASSCICIDLYDFKMICAKYGDKVMKWNNVLSVILNNALTPTPYPHPHHHSLDLITFEISAFCEISGDNGLLRPVCTYGWSCISHHKRLMFI